MLAALFAILAFFCAVVVRIGAANAMARDPARYVSATPLVGSLLGLLAVLLCGRYLWFWVPFAVEAGAIVLVGLGWRLRLLLR